MCIKPFAVIVQFGGNSGEVEIQHQIAFAVICGMLAYIKVSKQSIKLILSINIIIVLQHTYRQTFAESARADEEEKLICFFYYIELTLI